MPELLGLPDNASLEPIGATPPPQVTIGVVNVGEHRMIQIVMSHASGLEAYLLPTNAARALAKGLDSMTDRAESMPVIARPDFIVPGMPGISDNGKQS